MIVSVKVELSGYSWMDTSKLSSYANKPNTDDDDIDNPILGLCNNDDSLRIYMEFC